MQEDDRPSCGWGLTGNILTSIFVLNFNSNVSLYHCFFNPRILNSATDLNVKDLATSDR